MDQLLDLAAALKISTGMINNVLSITLLTYCVHLSLRAGIFSVAGVGFSALGGYLAANLALWGYGVFVAIVAAAIMSAAVGAVLGAVLGNIRRLYLTMATFAFVLLVQVLVKNGGDFTGGQYGLFGVPALLSTWGLLVLVGAVAGLVFLLERGVLGRALEAIRIDEQLARAMGVNVSIWRAATFVLCAAMGGVAGAANTLQIGLVTPEVASFGVIIEVLTIVVVGGTGAWYGPIIGAFVILWLPEVLSFSGEWRTIIQGLVVVVIVVFMPNGFVGIVQRLHALTRKRTGEDTASTRSGVV